MKKFSWVSMTCLLIAASSWAWQPLNDQQQKVLSVWLVSHSEFRLATSKDCGCDKMISNVRKGIPSVIHAIPNYDPYQISGDFNHDAQADFAVILAEAKTGKPSAYAIFNGPFKTSEPAKMQQNTDLRGVGFFFDPKSEEMNYLTFTRFEMDPHTSFEYFEPKGDGYKIHEEPGE